ncbi:hypothetical protein D3C71_1746560 [compost metagenome]
MQRGVAGAAFSKNAKSVDAAPFDRGGIIDRGVAVDRTGMDPGVIANTRGGRRIVANRRTAGQFAGVVDEETDATCDAHIDVTAARAFGPDAVAA